MKLIKAVLSFLMVFSFIASTIFTNEGLVVYANDEIDEYSEVAIEIDEEQIEEQLVDLGLSEDQHSQEVVDEVEGNIEAIEQEWEATLAHTEYILNAEVLNIQTREVSSWDELRSAISDSSVNHITLTKSITRSGLLSRSLPVISRDLVIEGNGHTLNFGNNQGFVLGRRTTETILTIQNLNVERIGDDYFIIHDDTSASGHHDGRRTENWVVHLHNIGHVENQTDAAMIKMPNSELILTGNIRWNTTNSRWDDTLFSTAGMIVVRGLTITNGATVNLRARNTVISVNPFCRDMETFVVINGGSHVVLYSRDRQAIWMNRDRYDNNHVENNPVLFTVAGAGTVVSAKSDGMGMGQHNAVISVAGGNPDRNSGIIIANGARMVVESTRDIGSGDLAMPAFIAQIHRGSFNIRGLGTRVELTSNGGNHVEGATLVFRRLGRQSLNVLDRSELVVNRLRSSSTAPAIRFHGLGGFAGNGTGGNTDFDGVIFNNEFNVLGGRVRVHNAGNGSAQNDSNQAIQYTSGLGTLVVLGSNSSVDLRADFGPAITSSGLGPMLLSVTTLASFVAEGRTSGANDGAINVNDIGIFFDHATNYDVINRRPNGGRAISAGSNSAMNLVNVDLNQWRSGNNLDGTATRSWPRFEVVLRGEDFRDIRWTSLSEFTAATFSQTGLRNYARIQGGMNGPRIPNDHLIAQINRVPNASEREHFTQGSWNHMIAMRVIADLTRLNANATRAAINEATAALRDAIDNLVDLRPLRNETATSQSVVSAGQGHYLLPKWNELLAAVEAAQAVLANNNATQRAVNDAISRLQSARNLEVVVGEHLVIDGFTWVVLAVDGAHNALVVTERIVGRSRGGATSTIPFEGSDLDLALTNFYNHLSPETREVIQPVNFPAEQVTFTLNLWPTSVSGGLSYVDANGTPRAFALSVAELQAYLGSTISGSAMTNNGDVRVLALPNVGYGANPTGFQNWWLRTNGGSAGNAMSVGTTGIINSSLLRSNELGVRPAMWIGPVTPGVAPIETASPDMIIEQLARISLLDQTNYTVASWNVMLEMQELAEEAMLNLDVPQEEIDQVASDLKESIDNLIDLSDLISELSISNEIKTAGQGDYLPASWQVLLASIEEAEAILSKYDATTEEIEHAVNQLRESRDLEVAEDEIS